MKSPTPKLLKLSACIILSLGILPYSSAFAADSEPAKVEDVEKI